MINKIKLILWIFPAFCFSMTFEENFSQILDSYKENFSQNDESKIFFSNNLKNDLKEISEKKTDILLLFFPDNCGLSLFIKDQNYFESIREVRDYVTSIGFKVTQFQIISEIAHFKNFSEMNDFYLKYFKKKADYELVENRFANHQGDYFFPIKFCLIRLKKNNL